MRISVIIPTFNRADILAKTLDAYARQSRICDILEIIVLDDGSVDHTQSVIRDCCQRLPIPLRYFHQNNGGLAAARNHAIREANADLLLFGDDDIIPGPDMVAEHVAWHDMYPEPAVGVLGLVEWARQVRATPFMKWSGMHGPQFNFGAFTPGRAVDFRYGYFCNTSIKSRFLRKTGYFSEAFREYGWEDIEFSYRLCENGYKLLYNPSAVGYHYKRETFEETRKRTEKLYQSAPIFAQTDAGRQFFCLYAAETERAQLEKRFLRRLLRPVKRLAMPILRPLVDSALPLPDWLYNRMFYHYVSSLGDELLAINESGPALHGSTQRDTRLR